MNSLEELIVKYEGSKIPYSELIKTKHWLDKRKTIIQRDKSICQSCKVKGIDLWDENILDYAYYKGKYAIWTKNSKTVDAIGGGKVFLAENFNPNKSLHVHHKLYYLDPASGRFILPWNYDDEHLEMWFQRNKSRDFVDEEISFAPGLINDLKFDIPIIGLAEKIVSERPIEDLLAYILDAEKFQNHTLSNCNNAATDILIEINDFGKINVGGIQQYQRGNQKLEVRKIAIE